MLELSKCAVAAVETEQDRWLKFFVEGDRLDDEHLPEWMQTEEMRQAMSTLKAFSEKERAYHAYQARSFSENAFKVLMACRISSVCIHAGRCSSSSHSPSIKNFSHRSCSVSTTSIRHLLNSSSQMPP